MNLTKGASTPIRTASGTPVTRLYAGAGWSVSGEGKKGLMGRFNRFKGVDLDLAAVLLDTDGQALRMAWFDTPDAFNGAVVLSGDNRTGRGDGDDESLNIDLARVPTMITDVVLIVSAFKEGVSFARVADVTCRLVDASTNTELGVYYPPIDSAQSAIVLARISRSGDGWAAVMIGEMGAGKSRAQLLALARSHRSTS